MTAETRQRYAPVAASAVFVLATAHSVAAQAQPGMTRSVEPDSNPQATGPGQYVNTAGVVRDFDAEYERQAESPAPHHLRTWTMMAGGLTALSLGYWLGMDRQVADWDNPRPQQRFDGTAWRTDNNALSVNYVLHPMAGGMAYSFARANHHGVAGSAAYGFLASFIWEFVLEFKEKVSVNDIVVTPAAGVPLGEFMYKLGVYLDSAQNPGPGTQAAQWGLGTAVRTDRELAGCNPTPVRARDSLGMTAALWHDFEVEYGFYLARGAAPAEHALYSTGLSGQLVSLPGYLRPGEFGRAFWRADLASMQAWAEFSGHGAGVGITSDVLIAGYHAQAIDGHRVPMRGQAVTTGVSTAYRYLESMAHDVSEKFSTLHLPGPAIDWRALGKHWQLTLSARAHPDYAGVGVLGAYPEWTAAHPGERGKHVTRIQGYYYGWGGSGELDGKFRVGPVHLLGNLFYGNYRSQEGNNRWQEKITIDTPMGTKLLFFRGTLQLEPAASPLAFGVDVLVRHWDVWVDQVRRRAHLVSRGIRASARF